MIGTSKQRSIVVFASAALVAVGGTSCDKEDWGPDRLAAGTSERAAERLQRGRDAYNMYCSGCHGVEGDGEGPAARFMSPKPRDFRKGRVKFASVAANEIPTDADIAYTIQHGLAGTSMPAWNLLPKEDIDDIVAYVKTFTPNRKAPGAMVPIPADPWTKSPTKGVAEGERVYHGIAACFSCHPAYVEKPRIAAFMKEYDVPTSGFRSNLYEGDTKDSEWGAPITPPDFLLDRVKSGTSRENLVKIIATGVGGTAMPSWGGTLTPKQLWGLAYYVEHLTKMRMTKEGDAIRKAMIAQPPYTPPPPPAPEPTPSADPSAAPSAAPSASASAGPSAAPSTSVSAAPTAAPTVKP